MKKTLMPLLIAAAVALSACGQDLSGGDWRTTGVVQAAGTISRSGGVPHGRAGPLGHLCRY